MLPVMLPVCYLGCYLMLPDVTCVVPRHPPKKWIFMQGKFLLNLLTKYVQFGLFFQLKGGVLPGRAFGGFLEELAPPCQGNPPKLGILGPGPPGLPSILGLMKVTSVRGGSGELGALRCSHESVEEALLQRASFIATRLIHPKGSGGLRENKAQMHMPNFLEGSDKAPTKLP